MLLYAIHGSHPCVAVERALELKGQTWKVKEIVPPMQVVVMRLRFGSPTVPAIRFDDGEKVQGSIAIMRRIDKRWPESPLYPADELAAERAAAESWGDTELQMIARRILFGGFKRCPKAMPSFQEHAKIRFPAAVTRAVAPAITAAEWRVHKMTSDQIARDLRDLSQTFDRIDAWIAGGVLDSHPSPTAADLQIASSIRLILTSQDVRAKFADRPTTQLALRLIPEYDGTLPAGTFAELGA